MGETSSSSSRMTLLLANRTNVFILQLVTRAAPRTRIKAIKSVYNKQVGLLAQPTSLTKTCSAGNSASASFVLFCFISKYSMAL